MVHWIILQAMEELGLSEVQALFAIAAGLTEDGDLERYIQEVEKLDERPNPFLERKVEETNAAIRELEEKEREVQERRRILEEEIHNLDEEMRRLEAECQANDEALRAKKLTINRVFREQHRYIAEAVRRTEELAQMVQDDQLEMKGDNVPEIQEVVRERRRILEEAIRQMEEDANLQEHQREAHEDNQHKILYGEAIGVPQDDHQRTL